VPIIDLPSPNRGEMLSHLQAEILKDLCQNLVIRDNYKTLLKKIYQMI
jgi:hypothetical protein